MVTALNALAEPDGHSASGFASTLVYSFVKAEAFINNLDRIRELLHRFGRETNQGEVAFEFDHEFFLIRDFDGGNRLSL